MKAVISKGLGLPAHDVWNLVKKSSTLSFVSKGLLRFGGAENFPVHWQQGVTLTSRLFLFGFIPGWKHTLFVEKVSDSDFELLTRESGGVVNTWGHIIRVVPKSGSTCTYSDEIEIKAGLFTPLIWLLANIFYRYRQRRWLKLISSCKLGA